jgi:frataxin
MKSGFALVGGRRWFSSFAARADKELVVLQSGVETLLDSLSSSSDVDCKDGVLTIVLPSGQSYVINKQTPNQQLWWSSPLSGPKRYTWDEAAASWRCVRTGSLIRADLAAELQQLLPNVGHVHFHD